MHTDNPRLTRALALGLGSVIVLALLSRIEAAPPVRAASTQRYVAPGGEDSNNACTDPAKPCASLQHAVDVAGDGDEILVAGGTYSRLFARPSPPGYPGLTIVYQVAQILTSVTVRGGYSGAFDDWDPAAYPTTLDARGAGRAIFASGDISLTLQGLHLIRGDATGLGGAPLERDAGGGLYVLGATLTLSGCRIADNAAPSYGGGVYLSQSVSPTLAGNAFTDNSAGRDGGGAYLEFSRGARLLNNTFSDNVAGVAGGGIGLRASDDAELSDSAFSSNEAGGTGGAIHVEGSRRLNLSHDTLQNNVAQDNGGGVHLYQSDQSTLSGNSLQGNHTSVYGGGIYLGSSAGVTLSQNTFSGNTAKRGAGLYLWDGSQVALSANRFEANSAERGGGIYAWGSLDTHLNGNAILGNVAQDDGGGVLLYDNANAWLQGNILSNNDAQGNGGGIDLYRSDARLDNNVIVGNRANLDGDGLYVAGGVLRLRHNTLARNDGSGLYVTNGWSAYSSLWLTNTILVNHTVGITVSAGNDATLNGVLWHANGANTDGQGAIAATHQITGDPHFAPDGYHITCASAALEQGLEAGLNTDLDGDTRPLGNQPDLGADEVQPNTRAYFPIVMRRAVILPRHELYLPIAFREP